MKKYYLTLDLVEDASSRWLCCIIDSGRI